MEKKSLGRGGQGEVWLISGDPPMVMKKALRADDYAGYLQELRTLKELSHENIVRYYDCPSHYPVVDREEFLLFMEYCEHGSLLDVLKDHTLIYSVATIAKWATELFRALEYVQDMKIVHQDVKPENLFLSGNDYIVKLGDFGIVRDLKAGSSRRGGTHGYMAPEVLREEVIDDQDAHKCDIYGAGWVVLDMINRSAPGSQAVDRIFEDKLPYLNTVRELVVGCTQEQLSERFGVKAALKLCETMTKEFAGFDIKPDPNPHQKKLVLPIGLDGQKNRALMQFDQMQPPAVTNSFFGYARTNTTTEPKQQKVDSRKILLQELKEKLAATTYFENREIELSELPFIDDSADPDFVTISEMRIPRVETKDFNKVRKYICDQFLALLSKLELEEQYELAEEIEKFYTSEDLKIDVGDKPVALRDSFHLLSGVDSWQQNRSINFGVKMLTETDQATLPNGEILASLDRVIKNVEELGKLFLKRLIYQVVALGGSRYAWLHLSHIGVFLRKDCTETRLHDNRFTKTKLPFYYTNEMEHLNSEQVRRALIEARTSFKRKLLNQRTQAEGANHLGATRYLEITLDNLMTAQRPMLEFKDAVEKLRAFPAPPFAGYYVFLYGIPPAHECRGDGCQIAGGFPATTDMKFRVHYHQCATSEQIDFLEAYTLLASALQYAARWRRLAFENLLYEPITELVRKIQSKEKDWVFFFELVRLPDGVEALLFEFYLSNLRGTFITKDFEIVYSAERATFLGIVPMQLADILPILLEISDYYEGFNRTKGIRPSFIEEDGIEQFEKMRELVDDFWSQLRKAEPKSRSKPSLCAI